MTCNFGRFSENEVDNEQWVGNNFINKKLFVEQKIKNIKYGLAEKTGCYEVTFARRMHTKVIFKNGAGKM